MLQQQIMASLVEAQDYGNLNGITMQLGGWMKKNVDLYVPVAFIIADVQEADQNCSFYPSNTLGHKHVYCTCDVSVENACRTTVPCKRYTKAIGPKGRPTADQRKQNGLSRQKISSVLSRRQTQRISLPVCTGTKFWMNFKWNLKSCLGQTQPITYKKVVGCLRSVGFVAGKYFEISDFGGHFP